MLDALIASAARGTVLNEFVNEDTRRRLFSTFFASLALVVGVFSFSSSSSSKVCLEVEAF